MLGGTADEPVLGGTGSITNASVLVPTLDQRYTDINGTTCKPLVANGGATVTKTGSP